MVGMDELGLDSGPLRDHFKEHLGEGAAVQILSQVEQEIQSPFFYFDAIYCITLDTTGSRWEKMQRRFKALGIETSVRIFRAVATPDNHHVGCALSHRAVIKEAQQQCLDNVLVFEDDALFLDATLEILTKSVAELKQRNWNLFYLGGHRWGQTYPLADGCRHLSVPKDLTCTHGVAYARPVFEKILADLPDSREEMVTWLKSHHGIDQYLRTIDKQFLTEPSVATQMSAAAPGRGGAPETLHPRGANRLNRPYFGSDRYILTHHQI